MSHAKHHLKASRHDLKSKKGGASESEETVKATSGKCPHCGCKKSDCQCGSSCGCK